MSLKCQVKRTEMERRSYQVKSSMEAWTALRETANRLLENEIFIKWLGEVMVRNGYWDNRELTPYSQGVRNGIAREAERLFEAADDGDKRLGEIFYNNIMKYKNQRKDK